MGIHRRGGVSGKSKRGVRALMDALEGRALMSGSAISLPSMIQIEETGAISSASGVAKYKVALAAGDMVSLDVNTTSAAPSNFKLSVARPGGRQAFSADDGTDPVTGQFTRDPSGMFRADASGVYTITVGNSGVAVDGVSKPTKAAPVTFALEMKKYAVTQSNTTAGAPVAMEPSDDSDGTNVAATQVSAEAGDQWTWVSGNTLWVTSADGSGYGITSGWKQTVTTNDDGTKWSTYATDGNESIAVTMPDDTKYDKKGKALPATSHVDTIVLNSPMTVTTQASMTGDQVGMVASMDVNLADAVPTGTVDGGTLEATGVSTATSAKGGLRTASRAAVTQADTLATSVQSMLADFLARYGISISTSSNKFGMATGANLSSLKFPLISDHTYVYLQKDPNTSVSFGGVQFSKADAGNTLRLAIDISNPALFVAVNDLAFGASVNGVIPFVPTAANYTGPTFSGHLWGSVSGIQVGDTPLSVSGTITLNLDSNRDGKLFDLKGNASSLFKAGGLTSTVLRDISAGVNGTLSVGATIKGINVSAPVGNASLAYTPTGPNVLLKQVTTTTYLFGTPLVFAYPAGTVITLPDPLPSGYQVPATTTSSSGNTYFGTTTVTTYSVGYAHAAGFQLAGTSVNPLAGTALESVFAGEQFSFRASSTGYNAAQFRSNFSADLQDMGGGISVLGYNLGGASHSLAVHLDAGHVTARGNMSVLAGTATVSGEMDPGAGTYLLSASFSGGSGNSIIPVSSFLNSCSATVYFGRTSGFSGLAADINLGFSYSYSGFGIYGGVSGRVYINTANNSYSGSLGASAGFYLAGSPVGLSASASVSSTNVTVNFGGFKVLGVTIIPTIPVTIPI